MKSLVRSIDQTNVFRTTLMRSYRFHAPKRLLQRVSLLALCMVLLCVCDARTAQATCGDYLAGRHASVMTGQHRLVSEDHLATTPIGDESQRPVCTGPQCRQSDPIPVTPTRKAELPQKHNAFLTAMFRLMADERSAWLPIENRCVVDGPTNRLLRPPRAV